MGSASPEARAVEIADGRELWTRHSGSGRDVVLIAGIGDDHHVWDPIFEALSRHRRVTAFDNRGVGRSAMGLELIEDPHELLDDGLRRRV